MLSGVSGASFYYIRPSGYDRLSVGQKAAAAEGISAETTKVSESAQKTFPGRTDVLTARETGPVQGENGIPEDSIPFLRNGVDPAEYAVRMRIEYLEPTETEEASESKSVSEVMEEEKCQTCEERKYQDGSDDMGVSFQTPTRIAPEAVASAVRGHEQEHVVREQAKAEREDRRVVSQSVTLHTGICPECGRVYISGGTTRTMTVADSEQSDSTEQGSAQAERRPFSAVA